MLTAAAPTTAAPSKKKKPIRRDASSAAARRQHELVLEYQPLVERLVRRTAARVSGLCDADELRSAALLGLLEAAMRFDESKGVPFAPFARHRILGAIMDELRARDHLPRPGRQRARGVEKAREKLVRQLGRQPSEEELARAAGEDVDTFRRRDLRQRTQSIVSLEDLPSTSWEDKVASTGADALEALCEGERVRQVAAAIRRLPERQQTILSLYFEEELSYREIGTMLGVTESRVCQIIKQAQAALRGMVEPGEVLAA